MRNGRRCQEPAAVAVSLPDVISPLLVSCLLLFQSTCLFIPLTHSLSTKFFLSLFSVVTDLLDDRVGGHCSSQSLPCPLITISPSSPPSPFLRIAHSPCN